MAFTVALAATAAAGLAMAGGAIGSVPPDDAARVVLATDTYRGSFKRVGPNTSITIKVRTRDGVPRAIRVVRYWRLPASCSVSGENLVNDGWRFTRFRVNRKRRFSITGTEGGSTIDFTGRFSKSFNKVRGRFQSRVEFPEPEQETCWTVRAAYTAKR